MIAATQRIALAAAAAVALLAAPAAAKDEASFVFTPLVPPNSGGDDLPSLTGVYQNQAIGFYTTKDNTAAGFVWSAGNYTIVPAVQYFSALSDNGVAIGNTAGSITSYTTYDVTTGATNTIDFTPSGGCDFTIGGINSSGAIAAAQGVPVLKHKGNKATYRPFEQSADGSYTWLAVSRINGLAPIGLTDDGAVVMGKTGGGTCGGVRPDRPYSLYRNGKLKKLTIPGATEIDVFFVTGSGFGGYFYNANSKQSFGFTSTGAKLKLTTYADVIVTGIGPRNQVAGYTEDESGYFHGFIYADNTYRTIDYPKEKSTIITGFSSTGAIIGYFGNNNVNHGFPNEPFIATCASDKGCTK